ncbi:MAG: hypothetical protein ACTS6J_00595, partial [Burkholderiales bacterium]
MDERLSAILHGLPQARGTKPAAGRQAASRNRYIAYSRTWKQEMHMDRRDWLRVLALTPLAGLTGSW